MDKATAKRRGRARRHRRVRKRVTGTASKPRLCVYRSNVNIYAQLIDDTTGRTLAAASSIDKGARAKAGGNASAAAQIGKRIAEHAKAAKIAEVVFDRGGNLYHGRVEALADAAREAGLKF